MATVQTLAETYYRALKSKTRENGDSYWTFSDDAPEDAQELAREIHAGMFPDDWKYEFLNSALAALSETEDPDEADVEADVFTSELTRWLASSNSRYAYCDDAQDEYGKPEGGIIGLVMLGQYAERREVLNLARTWLEDKARELDEAEELAAA